MNKPATIITEAKVFNVSSYRSAGDRRSFLSTARTEARPTMGRPASTRLALCAASGAIGRLYGAHVEAGVGAAVESRVESDDGRASGLRLSIRRSSRHNDGVVSQKGPLAAPVPKRAA